jgi:hypothetical protein
MRDRPVHIVDPPLITGGPEAVSEPQQPVTLRKRRRSINRGAVDRIELESAGKDTHLVVWGGSRPPYFEGSSVWVRESALDDVLVRKAGLNNSFQR